MVTGEIVCPKCKKKFVLDNLDESKITEVICPNCSHKFKVTSKCDLDKSKDECSWITHGEPRKAILSSTIKKTNRTTIAAILLTCVFLIGIVTAVYSENFLTTTLNVISFTGAKGSVKILVTDELNNTIANATILINNQIFYTDAKGVFNSQNIDLGLRKIKISKTNYENQTYELMIYPLVTSEIIAELEPGIGNDKNVEFNSTSLSMILGLFSIFSLLGAISSYMHRYFDGCIFCSLIGIFSFGFFFIGTIISIIAILIIWEVKDEFDNKEKGKIF